MNDKFKVGIVNYACPVCGKVADSQIIMNTKLTKKEADKIQQMHNKTIGFSDKPCKECQDVIDAHNVLFIVGFDVDKTTDENNPYRTGDVVGIKKDCKLGQHIINTYGDLFMIFMDIREMKQLNLISNAPNTD